MIKKNIAIISVVISIFFLLILRSKYEKNSLTKNSVFVPGKFEKIEPAYKGMKIYVIYKYKGHLIKNDFVANNIRKYDTLKTIFFKIDSLNPNKFDVELDPRVLDSLQKAYNGINQMP